MLLRVSYLHLKDKNLTVLQSRKMLRVDIKCRCGSIKLAMSTLLATVSKMKPPTINVSLLL